MPERLQMKFIMENHIQKEYGIKKKKSVSCDLYQFVLAKA